MSSGALARKAISNERRWTANNPLEQPAYSIIIPAYNESTRLGTTLKKIISFAEEQHWNAEIIIVDDGSYDNTRDLVQSAKEENPEVKLIENPGNQGKGYSVRNGMLHGAGKILLFSDADLSSPIEEAEKLFTAIKNGADIAIGSRWINTDLQTRRQPLYRQLGSRFFNLALRVLLGLKFKDTQCGFKAFSRTAAQAIFPLQKIERWGFDAEILYLAQKARLKVEEVPVSWAHSAGTRLHPFRDGINMFKDILKIRRNALRGNYCRAENIKL
jgi:dolichyl-phosphate beta-glucosyltransferase